VIAPKFQGDASIGRKTNIVRRAGIKGYGGDGQASFTDIKSPEMTKKTALPI
jgi:hypothetical protein